MSTPTATQSAVRPLPDVVAEVAAVLREHAAEADRSGSFPIVSFGAVRRSGLLGLLVPTEYGGLGGSTRDLVDAAQMLAGGCLSTTLAFVMHAQQVDTLVRYGSPALKARLLPRVAADGHYLASVTAEPATGGNLLAADEPLEAQADGFALTRMAPVVTGGRHADGFLVKMRTAPDAPAHDVTLVYVDRSQVAVEESAGWDALGMRATENVALSLRGRVPTDQVVGGLGGFRKIVVEAFAPAAHLGWSACWLGAARAGFSGVLREIRAGRVRGVDHRSDLTNQRLATIRGRLEVVSAYLHCVLTEVTGRQERGETLELPAVQIHLNTLKVLAARETYAAVDELVALAGLRLGYLKGSPVPLERLLRDLRAASLTYDDALLLVSTGSLTLLDPAVTTVGD
jgi:acyl-CoA dehydrogenase